MNSPAKARRRYRRLFTWTALFATVFVLGLFGLALIFPPEPPPPYALSAGGASTTGFDLRDLQLLVMVSSLIVAVVSFAGLGITSVLEWLERRREREAVALSDAGKDGRANLTTEPANERLRALRAVTSSLEETPARKT